MDRETRFFVAVASRQKFAAAELLQEMKKEEQDRLSRSLWEARAMLIEHKKRINRIHGIR